MQDPLRELLDRAAIVDVLSCYAAGLDARDWPLWRSVFLDKVVFDLSSWSGQPARSLQSDRVVRAQARIFAELVATQHFITNHRVNLQGDVARCVAHMRAEHWIGGAEQSGGRYTMFGYYDDRLVRTPDGWKIAEMQLKVTRTEGPRWVMDEAERRARARRTAAEGPA